MSKVLPLKTTRMPERAPEAIGMMADDLCADIRDVRTVVNVANETWSGEHDSFVGVLDLIDHKLTLIERASQKIMDCTKVPMTMKIPKLRRRA